ncbi:bifunctional acetate--CoA ligase family protein/GNAT family N-acetyltransferase (plasmid) [Photobacterium sp. GJ3]|uniref:bifunctional acetate--CoA ligase family protein/GNAT family N-acetyltransferase n=1 Tax=Photobacterium sp. GJ3 TaxID=2829502 RepID=UPI001B8AB5AB|nr:bifunctional acetate--CoA ligase family protein/GNAT family N-acetyltransferase [Photobacterium sp. GJ3]QUJ70378.1 bifunctional acetate--CoA ligase family protein/GNAT family N-acetyltransferase [Photobacterium sp. GJ3]
MKGLESLLKPRSVAVIGASDNPKRAGYVVMKNLLSGNFNGPIMPVTPKYDAVAGVLAYPDINSLPRIPDLAILCTQGHRNVTLIDQLGRKGVKLAIVLAAGMNVDLDGDGVTEDIRMHEVAKQYGMRLIGPNSMGMILPWHHLNASFSPISANKGNIAFVSQSAAVCTTILDWAKNKGIGFSTFISLGDTCDISFDELLDTLSRDSKTQAILLYIDSIRDARRFMSAARAAARNRRILVLKSGRTKIGSAAAHLHTGGEIGLDAVYDAAIRRSGMLRVHNTHDLFAAVETLAHAVPLRGERLAILTNGGGPAIMAVDALTERGGKLATLNQETVDKLSRVLPASWAPSNPIDIVGDADISRYEAATKILLDSDDFDALLIMHSPSAIAPSKETAEHLVQVLKQHPRTIHFNILSNWAGENQAQKARQVFTQAGFPAYRTPESAVTAFMHLVEYRRNQKQLMETPSSFGETQSHPEHVHQLLDQLLAQQIDHLETHEVRPLLENYGFQTLPTWIASDPAEAAHIAEQIGYPVAVKLRSPDIRHKSEVHGVMLHLRTAAEVANASQAILDRVSLNYPKARIEGLLVQRMANRAGAQELRIAVHTDPVFGPVILIGDEAAEWDIHRDAAVAIPPLNMALARYLVINALKTGKIKQRSLPDRLDIPALCKLLVKLSQLIIDCPEITELDIHPLLAAGEEMTVIDASMAIRPFSGDTQQRLAIRPYPKELELLTALKDRTPVLLRPIRPEDEPKHKAFIARVSHDDLYNRFFSEVGEFNHEALANLTQIDYDREMAYIAVQLDPDTHEESDILGVSRAVSDPTNEEAEFAVLVRSDLKGQGLGSMLLNTIIQYCRHRGIQRLTGITMPTNQGMLALARKSGFQVAIHFEDQTAELLLPLQTEAEQI